MRKHEASRKRAGREFWNFVALGSALLLGCDFQLPLDQSLPPCHSLSPGAQSHSQPGRLPGGQESLGEGLARCPTAQQGAPHCICPSSRDRDAGPGSGPGLLAVGRGRGSLSSPPPEVPWLSLFCQGDLFNHLIFWWPFIPRFHGYGPIKGRSNKAASQTGNKNIKAHVHKGRAGGKGAQ